MHGLNGGAFRIDELTARRLSVPLLEPFVIATGRVDATRAVEVTLRVTWRGQSAAGLGEAACLPPVTREDQDDVMAELRRVRDALVGAGAAATESGVEGLLHGALPDSPVARAGVESALLDGLARLAGVPLRTLLGGDLGSRTDTLETDVTVAIGTPARMGELARAWCARGFSILKIKVGKDVDADVRALEAVARAAPGARLRVDANAGYSARDALALARACSALGLDDAIECWEQPCAEDDLDGMHEVTRAVRAPVVADESIRTPGDLRELVRRGYARGANLKLAKFGGLLVARRMGVEAQAAGLALMVGGMVETRLGMTAAAHVACALGGVAFVDLDTAWLLAADPYLGGYEADGPRYRMPALPGLGIRHDSTAAPHMGQ